MIIGKILKNWRTNGPWVIKPSFVYFVTGGLILWFLAGHFTIDFSFSRQKELYSLSELSFLSKAGCLWAATGFLFIITLPTWFRISFKRAASMRKAGAFRTEPLIVALISTATRAVLIGAIAGFVLARWVVPHLDLPVGLVLSDSRSTLGAVLTAIGHLICVPVAAFVHLRGAIMEKRPSIYDSKFRPIGRLKYEKKLNFTFWCVFRAIPATDSD